MKTQVIITASIVLTATLSSAVAYAHGDHITAETMLKNRVVEIVYDDPAINRGIHSYFNPIAAKTIGKDGQFYVSQAYGPAIYSYPSAAVNFGLNPEDASECELNGTEIHCSTTYTR